MAETDKIEFLLNHKGESPCASLEDAVCERHKEYLTKEEAAVLAEIRVLRDDVLVIKDRLKILGKRVDAGTDEGETQSMSCERQALLARLEDLREKRKKLDELLEEAHHRKMVMLGHESP